MREMRTILAYLRKDEGRRTKDKRNALLCCTAFDILYSLFVLRPSSFVLRPRGVGLLEDAGDDLVERRVLHAHVNHGVVVEDGGEHLGDPAAVHLQIDDRPAVAGDL